LAGEQTRFQGEAGVAGMCCNARWSARWSARCRVTQRRKAAAKGIELRADEEEEQQQRNVAGRVAWEGDGAIRGMKMGGGYR
jgi:hypothetical protein